MANASRLKNAKRPTMDEASNNIFEQPEHAPAAPTKAPAATERIDGRTLRKTARTIPFATRVSAEYDTALRQAAKRDGLMLVEVMERALALYEAQSK